MSFRLRIEHVETRGRETVIRGRLIEGCYFGPQTIRVKDTMGNERKAPILAHSLIEPKAWPVTADHETQLVLHLPPAPFDIDLNSPVEGLGSVALGKGSTDLASELSNPLFWGIFSDLHMASDTMEQPVRELLGLSEEEVNTYYKGVLEPLINSTAWPVFPLDIDGNRYVEIEWSGGAECQERVWIGAKASGERALLGYNSGHFSLPGLRPSELVWLLDRLRDTPAHPAAGLLLMPMCYLPEPNAPLTERLAGLCARIPGANPTLAGTAATSMIERCTVPAATWERKPRYGWCSSWAYSQRNPQSPMSILAEADFGFIDQFFCEVK
jgi:hypothetical protein